MVVAVSAEGIVDEVLQGFKEFDESWWLNQPNEVRQLVIFDIDYA